MTAIFFKTFVGLQRRILQITDLDYHAWIAAILADSQLKSDVLDLAKGRRKYDDLDEGSAGIFPERLLPEDIGKRLEQKLANYSDTDRSILTSFLVNNILDFVSASDAE